MMDAAGHWPQASRRAPAHGILKLVNAELATVVSRVRQSLVQISNGLQGAGAGTIWHADGLILTNAHVVRREPPVVTLSDGRRLPARVLGHDPQLDLAALTVDATDLPTTELGNSKALQPGQIVLAIGHPWGVVGAATIGSVIDVGVPLEMENLRAELVQVGLHVRPGHSGGPLVDVDGRLVGINTMMAGPEVGFAVPVHVVHDFLRHAFAA